MSLIIHFQMINAYFASIIVVIRHKNKYKVSMQTEISPEENTTRTENIIL